MPSPILTVAATIMCPHGGQVTGVPTKLTLTIQGQPVLVQTDTFLVAGCPFLTPAGNPLPCVAVQWLTGATKCLAGGVPVLLQTSQGMTTGTGPPVPVIIANPGQVAVLAD